MSAEYVQGMLYQGVGEAWSPPLLSSLPQWPVGGEVAIDTETRDDHLKTLGIGTRRGAYVVGYSVAILGGPSFYVPIRHASGDNVPDADAAFAYLRDNIANFRGTIVAANGQYDLDLLGNERIEVPKGTWIRDVQVADPLINELHERYSLAAICARRGLAGKDETRLKADAGLYGIDPKKELWKLPGRSVSAYAIGDAEQTLAVYQQQKKEITEQNLWPIFDLESRLLPVLLRMRRRGVRVDQKALEHVDLYVREECRKALEKVESICGYALEMSDVTDVTALSAVLATAGVPMAITMNGKLSVKNETLEKMQSPIGPLLARARRMQKISGTFVNSIRKHMVDGRIHATFHQVRGAATRETDDDERGVGFGRLSCTDPNMQQQPARDEELAKMWRSIYLPEQWGQWFSNDYSQQEPRWATHYAEACNLYKAREFGDRYRADPMMDTYDALVQMTRVSRKDAKIIYLGITYSMGGAAVCRKLGKGTMWIPDERNGGRMREVAGPEGQQVIDQFHAGVPFIRKLAYEVQKAVHDHGGYITTKLGRRLHFPEKPEHLRRDGRDCYDWLAKALNRIIQGSSGDQVKKAMVEIDDAGHFMQLQLHDEIAGTCSGIDEAHQIATIMRNTVKLSVPMRVDVEVGDSWGGSMK